MTYIGVLTTFHTIVSLVAIVTGAAAVTGILRGDRFSSWAPWFLLTAIVTSVTGFFFPFGGLTPGMIVGVIALAILAVVLIASYKFRLAGAWRWIYAVGIVASLYLLVFVGVVQAFQKIAFLSAFAPTQSETPFVIAQVVTLALFIVIGALAVRDHPSAMRETPPIA